MILPTDQSATSAQVAPPAYKSAEAPAPRYTPKKDFGKAFAELQGRYGYDGAAPILISSEKKTKVLKDRSSSGSSTESKKSFAKSFKSFVTRSPPKSPERSSVASASSSATFGHDVKPAIDSKHDMKERSAGA